MLELGVGMGTGTAFGVCIAGDEAGAAFFWKKPVMVRCLLLLDWEERDGLGRGVAISLPSIPLAML